MEVLKKCVQAYGIPVQVYKHRRERKASIEVSLTTPYKGCVDHLGNVYKHLESMCGAYGIPVGIYKRRRENGLSLEEALCTPIRVEDRYPVQDHKGNRYSSIKKCVRRMEYQTTCIIIEETGG